jgi:hypothetical protein
MKKIAAIIALLCIGAYAFAQTAAPKAESVPVADGVLTAGEYVLMQNIGGTTLGATLSADGSSIAFGFRAPTKGWVAVGLGARRMGNASIFMGCDAAGKSEFSEQLGRGHSHSVSASLAKKSAVKNSGADTTIEFSVPAASFVKNGKIDMIVAYGKSANLTSMHEYYSGFTLSLSK